MTLATKIKSILHDDLAFELVSPAKDSVLMRYTVMVCPLHNPRNVEYGFVTTHLSIEDWCAMHKKCLIQCYINCTRPALPNEITDLF